VAPPGRLEMGPVVSGVRFGPDAVGAPPAYHLESVDNALRILLLLDERGVLRVYEAAEELGVARSTAHRLLATLRYRGFVAQDPQGRVYRPGHALAQLGLHAFARRDIRQVARPHLERLCTELAETVHLMVLEGNGVRFVDGVEGTQTVRVGLRVGILLPAHATAGGKALLAALPAEQVRDLYPRGVPVLTPGTLATLEQIAEELREVSRAGYATNFGESAEGVAAVAVAVHDPLRSPIGAVAVAAPQERMPRARVAGVVSRLQQTAMRVGDQMVDLQEP
jgi:DNA-binding IclR family transcriptional regulator